MRRALGLLVVVVVLVPALAAIGQVENLRDDFVDISYSGNEGSLDWSGPWDEVSEGDGPGAGQIRVADQNCSNNNCLQMRSGLLGQLEIRRPADLGDFVTATIELDLSIDALLSTGTLYIQARGNDSGWITLGSYTLLLESGESTESFDISALLGPDFELRFRLNGLLGGDRVYVDRVDIEGEIETATSTTSTSTSTSSSSTTSPSSSSASTSTSSTSTTSSSTSTTTSTTSSTSTTTAMSTSTTTASGHATTTTSTPRSRSSTTSSTTTSGSRDETPDGSEATTTTVGSSTTTSLGQEAFSSPPPPPADGGLREPAVGLLAGYRRGMMGNMEMEEVEVLGTSIDADFSLAVETFEAAKIWIAILALLITAALVSGMDWKRSKSRRSA